jgi:hypothetical protein
MVALIIKERKYVRANLQTKSAKFARNREKKRGLLVSLFLRILVTY